MEMTPRQRWEAVLNGEEPDRIPTDYWATPEVTSRLMFDLECSNETELWRRLKIDRAHGVDPVYIGPERECNLWGLDFKEQVYADGTGIYEEVNVHPFANMSDPKELDDYPWPSPDWFDFSNIPDELERLEAWPVRGGSYEPFLLYCSLRGLEQSYMDLALNPEFVEAALRKIFEFYYEFNTRLFEAAWPSGGVLFTYVAEDLGSQHGLLMSRDSIERFLIPNMKAMIDLAHSYKIKAFHHDDGSIREIIPRMIEIGIDVLNPIQWRCPGMEREELKRDFGEHLVFHGGVDNQHTIPFGIPQDIEQEVHDNMRILGAGGGYILAPCHNIQPITPTENIIALYEAVDTFAG